MREADVPRPKFEFGKFFTIIFERQRKEPISSKEKGVETLSENELKILDMIKENHKITKKEMSKRLTKKIVEWNIESLKVKSKIKRIGPDKGGYWEIVKE